MTVTTTGPAVLPGCHRRLGASDDGVGTNFAVWAPDASAMNVCLFDEDGNETRLALAARTLGVWHGYVPGVRAGQRYGYRADGPWDPAAGRLFNPDKLLLDPYARAVDGTLTPAAALPAIGPDGGVNPGDTARYVPLAVVTGEDGFAWGDDAPPRVPWRRTVVYEAHVRGLTKLNPAIPERLRGTFAGIGHEATTGYLTDLGVTTVELMPVQHFASEPHLHELGLVNYWGYNPVGFFAPHSGYSASGTRGAQVREFKQMVKDLHAAGLEVILDVVYNHTAEGGRHGPALSLRGLDDGAYYLQANGQYYDVTACGNTLNVSHPQALRLVMDSLRYWVTDMHVDGFRFDLASALCRNGTKVDLHAPFLTAVHQDPVLRDVKLIAEPWDSTWEGYLVGRFPSPWCEWNDRFRDTVRDFWRGRSGGVRDLAGRLSGSPELYADDGSRPLASVNFVTAHDGFALRDLVSYDAKHNEANGEANRDGADSNRSWNCGVEGESDDPNVLRLRRRQAANLLGTLLVAAGVPMVTAGDERGRTQGGNNNPFCLDDQTSWVSWVEDPRWQHLRQLAKALLELRARHPLLQRLHIPGPGSEEVPDTGVTWLDRSGEPMTDSTWLDSSTSTLGVLLDGGPRQAVDAHKTPLVAWFHAGSEPVRVTLPSRQPRGFRLILRTDIDDSDGMTIREPLPPGSTVTLADHTFALFEAVDAALAP